jgi:hypothetical protein
VHETGSEFSKPAPPCIARRPQRFGGPEISSHKLQGFNHLAAGSSPEPGAPSNERMRDGQSQGAARNGQAVGDQTPA